VVEALEIVVEEFELVCFWLIVEANELAETVFVA
jgi:hypothetical protein